MGPAKLRIGEVARRTDMSEAAIRAWERRYGVPDPERTEGGHRLYRQRDVDQIRAVQRLVDDGWSVAAAANEVREHSRREGGARARPVDHEGSPVGDLRQRWAQALNDLDTSNADLVLDDTLARFDVASVLDDVVLPVVREIAVGWEQDPLVIAREHVATNVIRPRLIRMLRTTISVRDRVLVAAAPEAEEHDIGLLAAAVVAAANGWKVHYVGPRSPSSAMERAMAETDAAVLLVGAVFREHAEAFLDDPPETDGAPVVLGGAGFEPGDEQRLPGALLHQGGMGDLPETLEAALS